MFFIFANKKPELFTPRKKAASPRALERQKAAQATKEAVAKKLQEMMTAETNRLKNGSETIVKLESWSLFFHDFCWILRNISTKVKWLMFNTVTVYQMVSDSNMMQYMIREYKIYYNILVTIIYDSIYFMFFNQQKDQQIFQFHSSWSRTISRPEINETTKAS